MIKPRSINFSTLAAMLLSVSVAMPLAAQTTVTGTYTPPKSGPRYVTLTVTYPANGGSMTLTTDVGFPFKCGSGGPIIPGKSISTCSATIPALLPVKLTGRYFPPSMGIDVTYDPAVYGPQWGGACAGTAADICALHPNGSNVAVSIDTTKPGAPHKKLGQTYP